MLPGGSQDLDLSSRPALALSWPCGWPKIIVEDFLKVTLPFIDRARSVADITRMVLDGSAPPQLGNFGLNGQVTTAYALASRYELEDEARQALALVNGRDLTWGEYDGLVYWSARKGIELDLREPPFSLRRWVRKRLPMRYQHWVRPE